MAAATLRRLRVDRALERPRVGVEHELQAWGTTGQHDFRRLIGAVAGQVRIPDPGDPRARRLASGLALTADGWEAELVTPPVPLGRDAPNRVVRLLERETGRLQASVGAIDPTVWLVGFSTHVNVSVSDDAVLEVAREFAERCAMAAMFLMDGPDPSGLLVRPRRGRLEVCGEYLAGDDLSAAVVFVSAATAVLSEPGGSRLPAGEWAVHPARERFGHFVPPAGHGPSVRGRGVAVAGTTVPAQEHLATVWAALRPAAVSLGLDPAPVDDRVAGRVPLAAERGARPVAAIAGPDPLEVLDPDLRRRGPLLLTPAWLTWTTVAWRCDDTVGGGAAHNVVPASGEADLLRLLDSGQLDRMLLRAARRPLPVLERNAQAARPGIWSDVRPEALVPAERGPLGLPTGNGTGGGEHAKDRRDEVHPELSRPESPRPAPRPGRPRTWWAAAAGALLVLGATAAMLNGAESPDAPAAVDSGSPASPPPTRSAAPPPTVAPEDSTAASAVAPVGPAVERSITYLGTLTWTTHDPDGPPGFPPEDGFVAGIHCRDDEGQDCMVTGFSIEGWDTDGLVRTGPGSFTASYRDDGWDPCLLIAQTPPVDVEVTIDSATARIVMTRLPTGDFVCDGGLGPLATAGYTVSFEGTYKSGSIPGLAP